VQDDSFDERAKRKSSSIAELWGERGSEFDASIRGKSSRFKKMWRSRGTMSRTEKVSESRYV
jgi:hypothetical protein